MPFRNNPAACALAKVPYVRAFSKIVDCLKGADLKSGSNCAVFKAAAAINSAGELSVMLIRSIKMKKITTFILMCALFAGLTALAGCKNDDNDELKLTGPLADGGITGSMQGWNVNTAKWTSGSESGGKYVYEYVFAAPAERVEWKVIVKKGDWEKGGGWCGDNKSQWLVKSDGTEQYLVYNAKGEGNNLYTDGLEKDKKYKITVTVTDGGKKASANVKKI